MSAPAVNVQLLSSSDPITAVFSQLADGAVSSNAAIYDSQVQEVQLSLGYARVAVLPRSGQDLLCILDVWPVDRL